MIRFHKVSSGSEAARDGPRGPWKYSDGRIGVGKSEERAYEKGKGRKMGSLSIMW